MTYYRYINGRRVEFHGNYPEPPNVTPNEQVLIDYTNWRGERRIRRIQPGEFSFGSNKYHPGEQWFVTAWDLDQNAWKAFAMQSIHSWQPATAGGEIG